MPYIVPGSDAANTARWGALSPSQRAGEQSYTDARAAETARKLRASRLAGNIAKYAVLGGVGAGVGSAVVPALFGGGSAAATSAPAWSMSGVTAPTMGAAASVPAVAGSTLPAAASGMSIGRILSNPLTSLGINTVSSIFGARAANNANRYAVDRQTEGLNRQIALEEARLANETAERQAQRVEDQRRWEAEEAYKAKMLAASEDERLYARGISDRRQARIDAYDPIRQRALRSVGSILGF